MVYRNSANQSNELENQKNPGWQQLKTRKLEEGEKPGSLFGNSPILALNQDSDTEEKNSIPFPNATNFEIPNAPVSRGFVFGELESEGSMPDFHSHDDHEDEHHDHEHHHDDCDEDHAHGFLTVDESLLDNANGSDLPTQGGVLDLAKTFNLHSNLDAKHTIYLDFDGHVTTDSAWTSYNGGNNIVTEAYDFDGNKSSFSNSELTRIQYIWQRVAEDFSPFNVNVTTQDPGLNALTKSGSGDTEWGVRVVIGAGTWFGSAGGVAFRSSFNSSIDRPTFVFTNYLGNGNEKYTAEAISHEAGHTLGLAHDGQNTTTYYAGHGSGSTGWAPILGNSYSKNLTQWSKGEYSGATNREDDLAIITSQNGFGYRADDHGNSLQNATLLTNVSNQISASGIIERNTDADVFSFFTGAGQVSLNLDTAPRGANLDILANLYDASGTLVATSNPLDALNASFTVGLASGRYFVEVMGTGKGDPLNGGYSNYGSLGQYTLNGTIVSPGGDFLDIVASSADKVEGNSGTQHFSFVVNRTGDTSGNTSVQYEIAGVGTNAASASDFVGGVLPSGTLDFAAGELSKVIEVFVNGDSEVEADESFQVRLLNPGSSTTLSSSSATGVIRNDDTPPALPKVSIGPASLTKNEGNSGTTAYQFTVSLDQASSNVVTVNYATVDGSATASSGDYNATSGTLTFNPGDSLSQTVTVFVNGDTSVESEESFDVQLSGVSNAELASNQATGVIQNDDIPVTETPANFMISDVVVSENVGKAVFTISRSGNTASTASVSYQTVNGGGKRGAKSGSDFMAAQNRVTFAAGEVAKSVEITILDDTSRESDEAFYVDLLNASSNASILDARGKGTIMDDDSSDSTGGNGKGNNGPKKAPRLLQVADALLGTGDNDTLVGAQTSIELQRGSRGQDTFVLGNAEEVFYANAGDQDFAIIAGFNVRKDTIQLHGSVDDYELMRGTGTKPGTFLFHQDEGEKELIAVIGGNKNVSLNSDTFRFV